MAQSDLSANYPAEINTQSTSKLASLLSYCNGKIVNSVRLEYHIECQDSKFSLSDIINYIALAQTKHLELEMIKGGFIKTPPPPPDPNNPKKIQLVISKKIMTVGEYRRILATQIQGMAGMPNSDEVEVTLIKD